MKIIIFHLNAYILYYLHHQSTFRTQANCSLFRGYTITRQTRRGAFGPGADDDDGTDDETDGRTEEDYDDDGTRQNTTGHEGTDGERIIMYIWL